jgi:hypothetical protein
VGRVWGGRFSLIGVSPATNGRIKLVRWAESGRSAGQTLWVSARCQFKPQTDTADLSFDDLVGTR